MKLYSEAAMERAMKVQEVILRAIGKRITWWQAAEILGISCRSMRRWRWRYEQYGYDGLYDRRWGRIGSPVAAYCATVCGPYPMLQLPSRCSYTVTRQPASVARQGVFSICNTRLSTLTVLSLPTGRVGSQRPAPGPAGGSPETHCRVRPPAPQSAG